MNVKLDDILTSADAKYLSEARTVGIDIGSRAAKGVLLYDGVLYYTLQASGVSSKGTAKSLLNELSKEAGISEEEIQFLIGTGYGRVAIDVTDIPSNVVTEISCHSLGGHYLNPKTKTIIDIGGQDSTVIGSGHYFGKPDQYEEALDELINELESLGENEYIGDWVPLLWSGGRGQEFGVYQAIDEAGGSILGWGSIPQIYALFDEEKPPLRAFAEYQMGGQMSGSTAAMYPFMESEIERSGAKGIFQYGYVGCSFAGIDGELKRKHFQEKGIPTMEILGSFQVGPPSGQLITRVKAFIEMLA